MQIKELSRQTGASIRSLRYYEAKQLITATRLPNGYREYEVTAIERIKKVQLYLSLGLSTDEIANIIDCPTSASDRPLCRAAYDLYKNKLAEVNQQLVILQKLQSRLLERLSDLEEKQVEE